MELDMPNLKGTRRMECLDSKFSSDLASTMGTVLQGRRMWSSICRRSKGDRQEDGKKEFLESCHCQ